MKKRNRYAEPVEFYAGPSWTVLVRNEALGTAHFVGRFETEDEAKAYADLEASRTRKFAEYVVHTGSPKRPGSPTGYKTRGVH